MLWNFVFDSDGLSVVFHCVLVRSLSLIPGALAWSLTGRVANILIESLGSESNSFEVARQQDWSTIYIDFWISRVIVRVLGSVVKFPPSKGCGHFESTLDLSAIPNRVFNCKIPEVVYSKVIYTHFVNFQVRITLSDKSDVISPDLYGLFLVEKRIILDPGDARPDGII